MTGFSRYEPGCGSYLALRSSFKFTGRIQPLAIVGLRTPTSLTESLLISNQVWCIEFFLCFKFIWFSLLLQLSVFMGSCDYPHPSGNPRWLPHFKVKWLVTLFISVIFLLLCSITYFWSTIRWQKWWETKFCLLYSHLYLFLWIIQISIYSLIKKWYSLDYVIPMPFLFLELFFIFL